MTVRYLGWQESAQERSFVDVYETGGRFSVIPFSASYIVVCGCCRVS